MTEATMLAEMDFVRDEELFTLSATSFRDGELCIDSAVGGADMRTGFCLTLQQTIQLRDFLNRHMDTLALNRIGASTERSSDDPAQLPSEHVVEGTPRSGMSAQPPFLPVVPPGLKR